MLARRVLSRSASTRATVRERLNDLARAADLLRDAHGRATAAIGPGHATTLERAAEPGRVATLAAPGER